MSDQTIRRALGKLQEDPDHAGAWAELQDAATDPAGLGMTNDALLDLLEAARREHAGRHEDEAVAKLLELETLIADGTPREADLQAELARVLNEVLDDAKAALGALQRLAKLRPDDAAVAAKIEAIQHEKAHWPEQLAELMDAAERMAGKPEPQSAMLYSAAQTAYRYGLEGPAAEVEATRGVIIERLEEARALDASRIESAALLERLYRAAGRHADVARVLESVAEHVSDKEARLAARIRLARVRLRALNDEDGAAAAYEKVLEQAPGHDEAIGFLVDYLGKTEQWDRVVALYEDALKARLRPGKETELFFQIAMTNWRMRGKPELAEPWFEKIRRAEPAHPAMLAFFREHLPARHEETRLVQILTDAQRAMGDGPERQSIAAELAKLSEETQGAGKAIETWKQVLRGDPGNVEARESLKRLYYRTEAWSAIVDLLRGQLDRFPANDAGRAPILAEIMVLHRDRTKQDTALVPILNQLVQIDPNNLEAVREQVRIFETLNRPRDLVGAQARLAELETEPEVKAELWRSVARQWLEKFSNVQNAVEAYEHLHAQKPDDEEATARLRELYQKRRAFKPLFELLASMRGRATGDAKRELTIEMAKLAAERLDKGADAVALYWELLEEDPQAPGVLDALEKQAERDKDFATLARVLGYRVDQADGDEAKVKLLEKLGALYESRLSDPQKAIETWRRILQLRPGYPKALRILRDEYLKLGDYDGLTEVYSQQEDWEGLADALSGAADRAEDPALRVDLSWRVASVYVDKIKRPERAARAYERILTVQPDDVKAARELVPILEHESAWPRLPAVYDVLLRGTEDTDERVRILRRLRELAAGPLGDRAGAFGYARRAYALLPTEEARQELEASARPANAFEGYVEALRERLVALNAGKRSEAAIEEKRKLQAELARVLSAELGKIDEAVTELRRVVDADPEDDEAVQALDRLLREARRSDDLRALYELRLERAEETSAQVSLLFEWAQLEEEAFGEATRALEIYKKALALAPDHRGVLRAITRLELGAGNAAAAVEALEKDRDLAVGTERAEREVELARLYAQKLARPEAALEAAVRALEIAPHDAGAIEVLEALEAEPALAQRAARQLEHEYEALGAHDKQARVLEVVLSGATDAAERRDLFGRLSTVHRERRRDDAAAFGVLLRAVAEFPADLELWDRLGELGAITSQLPAVAAAYASALDRSEGASKVPADVERELCERASILLEDKLSEPDAAIPYLERILLADPADAHAFTRLKQILTARERWDDLQRMYDRAIAASDDPHRRVELLAEVALVFEDILDDPARAASAYERVVAIEPENDSAIRSLDKLYQRTARFADLAALLVKQLDRGDDEARTALEGRLARLYLERLENPAEALRYAAAILERDVNHVDARAIARTVMERPETRVRAAEVLERVYIARDEPRDLDEVTSIRLAEGTLETEERIELLRRLAQLRDERLKDDAGALDALAKLVPLDPRDADARRTLLDVGRRAAAHARVADVLGAAAEAAKDVETKGEILLDQARVYEDLLDDRASAERVYRSIVDLAGADPAIVRPALKALERIYAFADEHKPLDGVLAAEVELEEDEAAKKQLLGRLGTLREGPLADRPGAIAAWKRRLAMDEADLEALEALDRLYTAIADYLELVLILRAREKLAEDAELRRTLLRRSAEVLSRELDDVQGAIEAYRTLLDDFGPDRPTLAALAALYEKAKQHRDLADAIEKQLELASEPADRVGLLSSLGALRIAHLDELAGGLEAYRDALTLDPSHAITRAALEKLLDHAEARAEAAGLLRPLYETENAGEKLLGVLEIQADAAGEGAERLEILATAVHVAESTLNDPKRAFELASRGLEGAADTDGVRAWLERVERLAAATSAHAELVALLRKVEPHIVDDEAKLDVNLRIAELARTRLSDRAVARTYYVRALELRADDVRALEALETLYEEEKDAPALLDILKRRVEIELDPAKKTALLFKQAALCEESLADAQGAIDALEQLVEGEGQPPFRALTALERLYGQVGRWSDVVGLLERQLGNAPDAPPSGGITWRNDVELHHELGVVARKHLSDVDRALDEFRTALTIDASYAPTIEQLEGMLEDADLRARAAEILEPVYLQRSDWKKVMQTLEVRLLDAEDEGERRSFLTRIANMLEDEGKDLSASLATWARLLAEDPTNESTWSELERVAKSGGLQKDLLAIYERELAKITSDDGSTAKLSLRAGELAEGLNDAERALGLYRRAHAVDPAGRTTFDAIDRLLRPLGRPDDRIALYREALDFRFEPAERIALLRNIAELHRDVRSDDSAAIDAFRELLEVDEHDEKALDALEALYSKTERWRDLADLLERRAEAADSPEKGAPFRLKLGTVLDGKLDDASGAIDRYEEIVQALPSHKGAIDALEAMLKREELKPRVAEILRPLYEGADDWRRLIDLGDERLALATDVGERTAILRETAKLWEDRGGDRGKAFDAIKRAWALDPEDGSLRSEADRLAEALEDWDGLVAAYEVATAAVDDVSKPDLLRGLADLHDRRRDDPRKSLETLERLHALDPEDLSVVERLDRLATLLGDWRALDRVLAKKAEIHGDPAEQALAWRRLGGLRRDMLDDAAASITAYEHALEVEPDSTTTLDALIELYEAKDDNEKLVELYQRRVDAAGAGEDALRYDLLMRRAKRAEKGLVDPREAIGSLRAALDVRPNDPDAARALERLYESEKMWLELLDAMRLRAATTSDAAERISVRKRIGELQARELDDASAALEIYRQVLDEAPADEGAITAVRQIGEKDEALRGTAADILEPVLRGAGRSDDLVAVLEMRLGGQQDPIDRARTLQAIARVHEEGRHDVAAAREASLRAFEETPDDKELREELARLAGLEAGDAGWRAFADALEKRAAGGYDAELAKELLVTLAGVCEDKLKDDARAASALAKAAEQAGDLPELLEGLDRLYARLDKAEDLADVLQRRIEVATAADARADLRRRLALLQIEKFGHKQEGLGTLRSAIEEVPEHAPTREALEKLLDDAELFEEVSECLEPVYRAANDHHKLASLFERRIDKAAPRDRTRLRLDLARVLEEKAQDPKAAQRQVERALKDEPTEAETFAELERLLPITVEWKQAADVVAGILAANDGLPSDTARDLWLKVAGWRRDHASDDRGAEEAFDKALGHDPENLEILKTIESLQRGAGREKDLVATLRRRAALEGAPDEKRVLLREAHTLAVTVLTDAALAEKILRELLKEDEANAWALEQLTTARAEAKDWKEVYSLLLRRAELASEASEQSKLRHEAARVSRVELEDREQAIELYRELLDSSDGGVGDEVAAKELRELYLDAKRFDDLAELIGRLIDAARSPEGRSALRLELASLQNDSLKKPEDAVDTLRAILEEEPSNTEAVLRLGDLYEKLGKDEPLAELLGTQIERASTSGDREGELALRVRLGELYASRLKDPARAIETYESVLAKDDRHVGALRALVKIHGQRGDRDKKAEALGRLVAESTGAEGAELALELSDLRGELKDDEGREKALRRALELSESAELKDLAARARKDLRAHYLRTQAWSELAAILVSEAELATEPAARADLYKQAAEIHMRKREAPGEAAALLEKASALVPDDRPLLLLLCDALSASGRGKDAADTLRKVIESFGGKRTKELAIYHHRLAQALSAQGEKEAALQEFDLAFKIDPGNVLVLRDLGKLALETGDLERAQKTFRALLLQKLDASSGITKGEVFFFLGEISHKQGDKTKAIQMFERAVETDATLTSAKERIAELKAAK
jgi:tetratricopeptide (TPR) repeat protein